MKKLIALSLAAFMFTAGAFAQTERATTPPTAKAGHHKGKGGHDKMFKDLNLTKEQKAQLKEKNKDLKARREALKGQDNITVKEMREKQKAIRDEQDKNMDAVLTPDQKAKYAEMKKQRGDKMKARKAKSQGENAQKS
jgi:Spy/CpxP family protein refolding chaperone